MTTKYCYNCMRPLPDAEAEVGTGAACPACGHIGPVVSAPHQLPPGTLLQNRYLLGRVLGQGGFGITHLGLDHTRDTRVAVKEYFPSGYANRNVSATHAVILHGGDIPATISDGKKRFLNEARTIAQFEGVPGVVGIEDYFEENDTAYLVMEFLEGEDLLDFLHGRQLSADEAFARMRPIMDALAAIHAKGIVHRDINPRNIKVLADGSFKLLDFGAARFVDAVGSRVISVIIKPGYSPEEQYSERGKQGPWTDIYALCATIYRCITGTTPPDAIARIDEDEDPIRWPAEFGIEISPRQEAALEKGMAVRRRDRFQSIGELEDFLNGSESTGAILASTPPREGTPHAL